MMRWWLAAMLLLWAMPLQAASNYDEEQLNQAIQADSDDARAWFRLGVMQTHDGRTLQAIEAFRQVIRIQPRAPEPHYNLAAIYRQLEDMDSAIEELKQVVALAPRDVHAQEALAAAYFDRASSLYRAIGKNHPGGTQVKRFRLATALCQQALLQQPAARMPSVIETMLANPLPKGSAIEPSSVVVVSDNGGSIAEDLKLLQQVPLTVLSSIEDRYTSPSVAVEAVDSPFSLPVEVSTNLVELKVGKADETPKISHPTHREKTAAKSAVSYCWFVNLSSFDRQSMAEKRVAWLNAKGVHASSMRVSVKGKVYYRVQIRNFATKANAVNYLAMLTENKLSTAGWLSNGHCADGNEREPLIADVLLFSSKGITRMPFDGKPKQKRSDGQKVAAVRATLERWRQAWSARDADGYLAAYSDQFVPTRSRSLDVWRQQVKQVFTSKTFVKVILDAVVLRVLEDDRVEVVCFQRFLSNNYRSNDHKRLIFAKQDGEWRIVREVVL
ncbi:MAG: SPOR domain-containing protein [Mariprofundales bacterium]